MDDAAAMGDLLSYVDSPEYMEFLNQLREPDMSGLFNGKCLDLGLGNP